MESRKITIVQTKNQTKSVIMSSATTLAELKADLRNNNIDYTDMTFFEGTSKVELKSNDAILPHDVPWKGTITNELVFMLTNTNKKIKSGAMSRKEVLAKIKELGLQKDCLNKFGKNFTTCKTEDLVKLIEGSKEQTNIKSSSIVTKSSSNNNCVNNTVIEAIKTLVGILYSDDVIDSYERDSVYNIIDGVTSSTKEHSHEIESSYSEDDIENMFSDMNI